MAIFASKKMKHIFLAGSSIAIIAIVLLFPNREWMNYLIIVFTGIIAYYLHIAHWHFFKNRTDSVVSPLRSFVRKVGFGLGLSFFSMGTILGIIGVIGGFSDGEMFIPFAQSAELGNESSISADPNLFDTVMLYVSSALAEETAFRSFGIGILMIPLIWLFSRCRRRLSCEKKFSATLSFKLGLILNFFIAIIFGLVHKDSPGFTVISFLNISISGFIYGYLFLVQKDIISAWSMHLSWNLVQIFVGLPVSGKYLPSASVMGNIFYGARDSILSGGSYGPEGSIVTVVVQLLLLLLLFKYLRRIVF